MCDVVIVGFCYYVVIVIQFVFIYEFVVGCQFLIECVFCFLVFVFVFVEGVILVKDFNDVGIVCCDENVIIVMGRFGNISGIWFWFFNQVF